MQNQHTTKNTYLDNIVCLFALPKSKERSEMRNRIFHVLMSFQPELGYILLHSWRTGCKVFQQNVVECLLILHLNIFSNVW